MHAVTGYISLATAVQEAAAKGLAVETGVVCCGTLCHGWALKWACLRVQWL
jgi:hypothetical protein